MEATQEFEREQKKFVDTKPAHEREHSRVGVSLCLRLHAG